jgi:hypothetical protein
MIANVLAKAQHWHVISSNRLERVSFSRAITLPPTLVAAQKLEISSTQT